MFGKRFRLRQVVLLALSLLAVGVVWGCGKAEDDRPDSTPEPVAAVEFPSTDGRTLEQFVKELGEEGLNEAELAASPTGQVFDRGPSRFAFGVFTLDRKPVDDAEVALYFAPGADGEAVGPFPAEIHSLETPPAYRGLTSEDGPDAPSVVYVVPEVDFNKPGEWRGVALLRGEEGFEAMGLPSLMVDRFKGIPKVGEKPPRINTPTENDVADIAEIDTRVPPDQMHKVNFADVLGKKPTVLVYSTPQLCESRVCGPVVDMAEQAREEFGDRAEFIHMEIFRDNDPSKGPRPQLTAFGLQTEPWVFVVDKDGIVDTRIEGAFGVDELHEAVLNVVE